MKIYFVCDDCGRAYRLVEINNGEGVHLLVAWCNTCFENRMKAIREEWIAAGHPIEILEARLAEINEGMVNNEKLLCNRHQPAAV